MRAGVLSSSTALGGSSMPPTFFAALIPLEDQFAINVIPTSVVRINIDRTRIVLASGMTAKSLFAVVSLC